MFQFWIEGVTVPIIASFGIIGNFVCLVVLSNKSVDLKPSFSNLLKCLSVYDILILVMHFVYSTFQKSGQLFKKKLIWANFTTLLKYMYLLKPFPFHISRKSGVVKIA